MKRTGFCLFLAGLLAAANAPSGGEPDLRGCVYDEWAAPEPLTPIADRNPRHATLSSRGGRTVVIGHDRPHSSAITESDSLVMERFWVGMDVTSGREIPPPPGASHAFYPQGGLDGDGRLHAVWADDSTRTLPFPRRDAHGVRRAMLWYAVHEAEAGWSTPFRVLAPDQVEFNWSVGTALNSTSVDSDGRVHLAIRSSTYWGPDPGMSSGSFHHVLLAGGSMRVTKVAGDDGGPTGTEVPSVASGDTVFAVSANRPDFVPGPGPGEWAAVDIHIFVRRSTDAGRTWEEPIPVGEYLGGRVGPVYAMLDPSGDLHIAWASGLSPGTRRQVIRHARVDAETGEATETLPRLDPQDGFFQFAAAVDRCGSVHVVYREFEDDGTKPVHYAVLTDGTWSEPVRPFEFGMDALALAADEDGLLLYGLREYLGPPEQTPRLREEPVIIRRPFLRD